jgi:hypothetical protein
LFALLERSDASDMWEKIDPGVRNTVLNGVRARYIANFAKVFKKNSFVTVSQFEYDFKILEKVLLNEL